MKSMLTGVAAIQLTGTAANQLLQQAGFTSADMRSGPVVRLNETT
ncbi:hypothetical protein [Parasedimentitalea psychrophila]|uniref:Uncharacterized protein n=1 Tax=Parasedimentitalea psychrophila TaxID=2997337 RepID=A0A9Y2P3H5_9RHOB|nr:hypothetical protein [Parasedimentitalea psychrophila]WIY26042.1 hypothetical protein QPJ95_03690 [Parasedimentitalea psychrophila]